MKCLVIGWAVAALFAPALGASADSACRTRLEADDYREMELQSLLDVKPLVLTSVTFPIGPPGETIALKGILCDNRQRALAGFKLPIVRVERTEAAGDGALAPDAIERGEVRVLQTYEVVTSDGGRFLVPGLPPGEYAFRIDWRKIGSESVVLDLRHIPGPALQSSVERVGLMRP